MIGGRGIRPTRCVSTFATVGGMDEQLAAHPGHRVRVRWITPREAESVAFDAIGWPSGCGRPPYDFERTVRAADENRRTEGAASLPWPPDNDTLTFADIPRRLPRGRAHEAMRQAWPRILEEDQTRVRAELIRRGWTPEEFELCGSARHSDHAGRVASAIAERIRDRSSSEGEVGSGSEASI